jgi:hypothetical protein
MTLIEYLRTQGYDIVNDEGEWEWAPPHRPAVLTYAVAGLTYQQAVIEACKDLLYFEKKGA